MDDFYNASRDGFTNTVISDPEVPAVGLEVCGAEGSDAVEAVIVKYGFGERNSKLIGYSF